jgi:tryptophan synthase alpha chain
MALIFRQRPSLVAYLTCGDPDLRTSRAVALACVEAGAEVLELGVPFSDPVADGPVIQRASERALRHHVSLENVLKLAAEIRRESAAGLIVFTYLNPIMRIGMEKFATAVSRTGVTGARKDLADDAQKLVQRLRKFTKLPIVVGFGISQPEHFAAVGKFADGAAIGTAIVHTIEQNPGKEAQAVAELIKAISHQPSAIRKGNEGARSVAAID